MIPKLSCRKCGNEIVPSDRFCSTCGTMVDWPAASLAGTPTQETPPSATGTACTLCGQINPPGATACTSCGAALQSTKSAPHPAGKKGVERHSSGHSLRPLQTWKLPAGVAVLLVLVLVAVRFSRKDPPPPGMPPSGLSQNAQTIVKEIESLQEALKTEPKNSTALLRLANLYYDTRAFASAIMMYDRYLEINPANPDARVDLGTAYFEMALRDSMNREQYLTAAKEQMVRALSVNPRHQLAHYNLGMVSLRGGNLEEANDWFRKCAAIDSNTETGRRALQLVKQHSFTNPS